MSSESEEKIYLIFGVNVEKECLEFDHINNHHCYLNALVSMRQILELCKERTSSRFILSIYFLTVTKNIPYLIEVDFSDLDLEDLLSDFKSYFQMMININVIHGLLQKKKRKSSNFFYSLYTETIIKLNGRKRIVFVLKSSLDSIISKEKKNVVKLIDDFTKLKVYQINYANFKFDYRVDLGKIILQKKNDLDLDLVNGTFLVDTNNLKTALAGFDSLESKYEVHTDMEISYYSPNAITSYHLETIDLDKLRKLRLSQGWHQIKDQDNIFEYTKINNLGIYKLTGPNEKGLYIASIQRLNLADHNTIMVEETEFFDTVCFNFLPGLNERISVKSKLYMYIKKNSEMFSNFETKVLYDQKASKLFEIKEFTLAKADRDICDDIKYLMLNLDWELNKWSSDIKFEIKFYNGLLLAGKKDEYLCFCHLKDLSRNFVKVQLLYHSFEKQSKFKEFTARVTKKLERISLEHSCCLMNPKIHKFLKIETIRNDLSVFKNYQIKEYMSSFEQSKFKVILDLNLENLKYFTIHLQTLLLELL